MPSAVVSESITLPAPGDGVDIAGGLPAEDGLVGAARGVPGGAPLVGAGQFLGEQGVGLLDGEIAPRQGHAASSV
jgi:hypothetical protein